MARGHADVGGEGRSSEDAIAKDDLSGGDVAAYSEPRHACAHVVDELCQSGYPRLEIRRRLAVEAFEKVERRGVVAERLMGARLVVEEARVLGDRVGLRVGREGVGVAKRIHRLVAALLESIGAVRIRRAGGAPGRPRQERDGLKD